jgi:hypothetical protein
LLSTTISFEFVLAINLRERFAMVRACRPMLDASMASSSGWFSIRCARRRQQYRLCRGQSRTARDEDVPSVGLGASSPLHQVLMETSMTEMRTSAVTRPKIASNPLKGIG